MTCHNTQTDCVNSDQGHQCSFVELIRLHRIVAIYSTDENFIGSHPEASNVAAT
jgi:hypothetical protein